MKTMLLALMLLAGCIRTPAYSEAEQASIKTVDAHARARLVKLARR